MKWWRTIFGCLLEGNCSRSKFSEIVNNNNSLQISRNLRLANISLKFSYSNMRWPTFFSTHCIDISHGMNFLTKKLHSNLEALQAKPLRASKPMTKEQHWRKLLTLHLMVLGHEKPLDAVLHTAICVHSQEGHRCLGKLTFRYQFISNLYLSVKEDNMRDWLDWAYWA